MAGFAGMARLACSWVGLAGWQAPADPKGAHKGIFDGGIAGFDFASEPPAGYPAEGGPPADAAWGPGLLLVRELSDAVQGERGRVFGWPLFPAALRASTWGARAAGLPEQRVPGPCVAQAPGWRSARLTDSLLGAARLIQ